jgi:hypothetical protein
MSASIHLTFNFQLSIAGPITGSDPAVLDCHTPTCGGLAVFACPAVFAREVCQGWFEIWK